MVNSCALLTMETNNVVRPVHERMPVILRREDYDLWPGDDARERGLLAGLRRPYPATEVSAYPEGEAVNNLRCRGAGSIKRAPVNSV